MLGASGDRERSPRPSGSCVDSRGGWDTQPLGTNEGRRHMEHPGTQAWSVVHNAPLSASHVWPLQGGRAQGQLLVLLTHATYKYLRMHAPAGKKILKGGVEGGGISQRPHQGILLTTQCTAVNYIKIKLAITQAETSSLTPFSSLATETT